METKEIYNQLAKIDDNNYKKAIEELIKSKVLKKSNIDFNDPHLYSKCGLTSLVVLKNLFNIYNINNTKQKKYILLNNFEHIIDAIENKNNFVLLCEIDNNQGKISISITEFIKKFIK
jgi:hypothetical protein